MPIKKNENVQIEKIVVLAAITVGIYLSFRYLLPLFIPFLIASVVSVFYYPFLRKISPKLMQQAGRRKKIWLAITVVFLYLLLAIFIITGVVYLLKQGRSMLLNLPFYQAKLICLFDTCCVKLDGLLQMENGSSALFLSDLSKKDWGSSISSVLPKVTTYSVQMAKNLFQIIFCVVITILATFFLIMDYERVREKMIASEIGKRLCHTFCKCKDTMRVYVKAQAVIMLLDGTICTLAFFVIRQPYFLVLGPLVGIVDALPILGAGLILLPYGVFLLLGGKFWQAFVIFGVYVGCVIIRQFTEPRMIGKKIEVRPLFTLISMYVGFKLFGIFGFLLGPIGILLGKELYTLYLANHKE